MSRPYTVRPPVRKPIDFQNAAAVVFVGVTSRSIRSTRLLEEAKAMRERAPDSLPTHCGIDEEVIEDEEPAFLRGRRVNREGHADDRALLPRDEDDAADAVAHDLFDGPRNPFGPRLHAFGGEVGGDETFHVEAVRRIRALDEDHRPRATSRGPIRITPPRRAGATDAIAGNREPVRRSEERHANGLPLLQQIDVRGNLDVAVRMSH